MGTESEEGRARPDSEGVRKRIRRIASLGPGGLFAGRYAVHASLGSGGAGEVYRAEDTTAGIDVALKIQYPGPEPGHDLERLRREVRILRSLQHPGIVRIFDIGEVDGVLYAVSELLEGESLAERIRRDGSLPPAEAERVLRRILEALATAHAAGVVHRDIKPANVFLRAGADAGPGSVVLLDFGLARSSDDPSLTATGHFVGTPEYCAPEQVRGGRRLSPATDLYACGILLWAMLRGKPPFEGDSQFDVQNAQLHARPPARRELRHAPPRLRSFALACLEKRMEDRPPDAAEALRMLDTPVSLWKRGRFLWPTARGVTGRWRRILAVAALTSAALVAIALGALWLLTPVGVRHQGSRIYWRTRSGWEIASPPFERPVASIRMVGPWLGPFGKAYVGVWSQREEGKPWRAHPPFPPMLYVMTNLLAAPRPVFSSGNARRLEDVFYPRFDPAYVPAALLDLPGAALGEGPRLVMDNAHVLFDPSRLLGADESGRIWFVYDHPGPLPRLATFSPASGPRLVLAAGTNDLLGPRNVVVALRAGEVPPGQGPPYMGPHSREETSVYYLFLPHEPQMDTRFRIEGGTGVVELEGRAPLRFDAATGIPIEASDRGGLTAAAWDARRRRLLRALFATSELRERGQAESAARLLEGFAAEREGSPELLSIALYRASQIRMREAAGPEVEQTIRPTILERALDDIENAILLESPPRVPPHYPIVQADLLLRLGRAAEARSVLERWMSSSSAVGAYHYPWLLLQWRAGSDPPPSRALAGLPDDARAHWASLIRLASAVRRSDFAAGRDEADRLDASEIQCDTQHYWAARVYLDAPVPDPVPALAHLDRAEESFKSGIPVPLAAARLRAEVLRDPSQPPDAATLERVRRDLEETADCAATSAECLTLLALGERDLAAAIAAAPRR